MKTDFVKGYSDKINTDFFSPFIFWKIYMSKLWHFASIHHAAELRN